MPFLSKVISFWKNIFLHRQLEVDLNDELQAYVEEMIERRIQAGVAPEAAREMVLLELGGIERIKDLARQQRIGFGKPGRSGVMIVAVLVAFITGASGAVGVMRRLTPTPVPQSKAPNPEKSSVPRERPPVLEGRVVDNATGQPIPSVEIGLRETPIRRYTYTDDTGHFIFSNPPAGFYWLESGTQKWTINQVGSGLPTCVASKAYGDFFEFSPNSAVSVKSKDGRPLNGEQMDFHGAVFSRKPNAASILALRRFRYSDSVVELHAVNLSPGKIAGLGTETPTLDRVR